MSGGLSENRCGFRYLKIENDSAAHRIQSRFICADDS